MPYILQAKRDNIDPKIEEALNMAADGKLAAGDINYIFTRFMLAYMIGRGKSYQNMNDLVGAIEACKLEFYRRYVANYEQMKAGMNGDVY